MKELYLSDLHLGALSFNKEQELEKLLLSDFDRIIFVGDIIDTWENSVRNITYKYRNLFGYINNIALKIEVIIVRGNHDPEIETLQRIFYNCKVYKEYYSSNIVIVHGHRFDSILNKFPWIYKFIFCVNWVSQRMGIDIRSKAVILYHYIAQEIDSITNKNGSKYHANNILNSELTAIQTYITPKHNILIMGHTHWPKIIKKETFIYINCGDIVNNNTYVVREQNKFYIRQLGE